MSFQDAKWEECTTIIKDQRLLVSCVCDVFTRSFGASESGLHVVTSRYFQVISGRTGRSHSPSYTWNCGVADREISIVDTVRWILVGVYLRKEQWVLLHCTMYDLTSVLCRHPTPYDCVKSWLFSVIALFYCWLSWLHVLFRIVSFWTLRPEPRTSDGGHHRHH